MNRTLSPVRESEQVNQNKGIRKGEPEQGNQNKGTRTREPEQGNQNRGARRGELEHGQNQTGNSLILGNIEILKYRFWKKKEIFHFIWWIPYGISPNRHDMRESPSP
jgi:hypothetical protein